MAPKVRVQKRNLDLVRLNQKWRRELDKAFQEKGCPFRDLGDASPKSPVLTEMQDMAMKACKVYYLTKFPERDLRVDAKNA